MSERGLRLALQPRITLANEEEGAVKEVIEGRADLAFTVAIEVLPKVELVDFKSISLDRPVLEVTDDEIDEMVANIAESNRPFTTKTGDAKAEKGDRVMVSFVGTIDGEPFEGGTAEDVPVVIGQGNFIPGFEEQLIGMRPATRAPSRSRFPKNYLGRGTRWPGCDLRGHGQERGSTGRASRSTTRSPRRSASNRSPSSRSQVRERIARGHAAASRAKVKRALLDALDKAHKFELPPSLVEQEFAGIWASVTKEIETSGKTFADEGTTEEKAREEYRVIADRRVRLGLVIAEIGEKNEIKVTEDELTRALIEQARQYPGQEQEVFEQYRRNPDAIASLRAPIFEDKVVDFVLELAKVTDKKVSREELYGEDEEDRRRRREAGASQE